jgi:peptidoglycan/LPS O-acetylase OafA/YrhL
MAASTTRSIPSLDGLRAASVAVVIVGHSLAYLHGEANRFPYLQLSELGQSGVDVFFVISGFLITYLLLKENDATGTISLRNFYFRRFFRIFPPFYAYLAVVGILWVAGVARQDVRAFLSAATYTWNYAPHATSWLLAHTWSLSLEEQFYVLWPPCLVLLGRKKSVYAALSVVVLSPAIRLLSYVVLPSMRGQEWVMLHTRLDTIMFGCAMALLWNDERFQRAVERVLHPGVLALAGAYTLAASPFLTARFQAWYEWPVGYTLRALLISIVFLYVVKKPTSALGRALNYGMVRHFGVISYSLYLWQQMFTGSKAHFPLNLLAILACAELSYWVVERPSFRLRDWLALRSAKLWGLDCAPGKAQAVEGTGGN